MEATLVLFRKVLNRKQFLFPLFLFYSSFLSASESDSTCGKWNVRLRGDLGFIIAHRPQLVPLQQAHVKAFEFSLAKISSGEKDWQSKYLFPEYGLTIAGFDLGSETYLGNGIAVYPYIDFPLSKNNNFHFRYGIGLGYIEKIFNAYDNYKNAAIGSHLNGVLHFDLHFEKNFSKGFSMEVGAGITHFSSGSFSMPNLGINIASVNLGVSHSIGDRTLKKYVELPTIDRKTEIQFYVAGSTKKIYPPLGKTFYAFTLSAIRYKKINYTSAWGIGGDIFHDNSIAARIDRSEAGSSKESDNFRAGLYGAYELSVGRIGMMFNMGFYFYNQYKDDGNFYQRVCTRYYFNKTFICVNLKSHFARADFIEIGFGYRFKKI